MSITIETALKVPEWIAAGLATGAYERIGGVVRDAQTKQVVAWLRETSSLGITAADTLVRIASVASILNLAIATMEFAVVMKRLGTVEQSLQQVQEILAQVDRKLDISFYAQFRAALDLAVNAFTMTRVENRRDSALLAINRFLEAEHHYTALADAQLERESRVAGEYLMTLFLAYATEARCYLELEELETAQRRLGEGVAVLQPLVEKHVETLLTSNPAAYLHPDLKGQVDLRRLTRVYQWLNPALDENAVFEAQRESLVELLEDPGDWMDSLPPAVWDPAIDVQDKGLRARVKGRIRDNRPLVCARLPLAMETMEVLIESERRFATYQSEVLAIRQLGLSFGDWLQFAPMADVGLDGGELMCIILSEPVELAA